MYAVTRNLLSRDDVTLGAMHIPNQDLGEVIDCYGDNNLFGVIKNITYYRLFILEFWACHYLA